MKYLEAGNQAPAFSLPDQDGNIVSLSDFTGQNRVLVYFYPKAMTPGCTTQACGLRDNKDALDRHGVVVLGISPDPVARLEKFTAKYDLNFTLLADENHAIADQFGAWGTKKFMGRKYDGIHRTSFLINEDGVVEKVFDKFKTSSHHETIINYLEGK